MESAKRKERRDRRPPEKKDEDNANRRLDWAIKREGMSQEQIDKDNANRRKKYQGSDLQAANDKRRLKYLQMTSEEKSIVRKKGTERFRIHRAKMIGPSVECAEYGCKSLVPLIRDERYCYRHRGCQRIKKGWDGEPIEVVYKNRSGLDATISLQALIEKFGDLHQCEGPNCKLKINLGPCLKSKYINSGGRRVPKSFESFDWGGFPKFCQVCEPEIDAHRNQPLELKCSSQEMYSTVISSTALWDIVHLIANQETSTRQLADPTTQTWEIVLNVYFSFVMQLSRVTTVQCQLVLVKQTLPGWHLQSAITALKITIFKT